jgi:hypothetical protein
MPRISAFHGIVIWMYPDEGHHRRPHFHAEFGEWEASFDIETLEPIVGRLPGARDPSRRQMGPHPPSGASRQLASSQSR